MNKRKSLFIALLTFFLFFFFIRITSADTSSVCCDLGDTTGDTCIISSNPLTIGRCRVVEGWIEASLCGDGGYVCDDNCCNPLLSGDDCHPPDNATCTIHDTTGTCPSGYLCAFSSDPGTFTCNCTSTVYGTYNCLPRTPYSCSGGYIPNCNVCGPSMTYNPCGSIMSCSLPCIVGTVGGEGESCICNSDCNIGLYCSPSGICHLPVTPTPTLSPGTCSCNLGYYTCTGVNTNNCIGGSVPECQWNYDPGTYGYCTCSCITQTPSPTPPLDACATLCSSQGKTSQCAFDSPSDDCTDSGTLCDLGAAGVDPKCWCCGGSSVQTQCDDFCDNPDRSYGNCLPSAPDQTICERPSDEDGSGLDDDGSIDCNINNVIYDCWCCDRIISDLTPRPTLSVFGSCPVNSIDTAIGCLPVGDKNAFLAFVLRWAIGISGGVSFILIIFSGFNIMTAAGDKRKLQSGKELLTAALSGLILIIFSVFILDLIGIRILKIPSL